MERLVSNIERLSKFVRCELSKIPGGITDCRLPNNTKPESYNIFLSTDIADGIFDYNGVVKIKINILNESNEITLHQYNLDIKTVKLTTEKGEEIPIESPRYDLRKDFVIFKTINHTFMPREKVFLEINFKGILGRRSHGFYRSSYICSTNTDRWLATTILAPTNARRAFPCYDEPALKATFNIQIAHSPKYTAISNMLQIERKESGSQIVTRFQQTPLMSTYLLAFIVSDFDFEGKIDANGLRHRIYSQPDKIDILKFVPNISDKVLTLLRKYLNVEYAMPKIDHAAIPAFSLFIIEFTDPAMENFGLITYNTSYLLPENVHMSKIVRLIAHELAHQWFGNLVTFIWWNYLWISEGFARLFEFILTDLMHPECKVFQTFVTKYLHRALKYDDSNRSHPMTYYVEDPSDIKKLFDKITYDKASSVLRMFMHAFTQNSFRKGLTYFLTENAFKSVADTELFECLERAVKEDDTLDKEMNVKDIFSSWSDQKGYPLLIVTRNYIDNTIEITQERYFTKQQHPEANLTSWWIPYNFDTANNIAMDDTKPDGWLAKGTKSMIIKSTENKNWTTNDWVLFNKQQTGFYRVIYDERNYQMILDYLKSGKGHNIHEITKAQLLDDIREFHKFKRLSRRLYNDLKRFL